MFPTLKRAILLFLKHPTPGQVKTRLGATMGAAAAAEVYRWLVAEVCRRVPQEDQLVILYDPPERRAEIEAWIPALLPERELCFWAQAAGDLGARLTCAFEQAFGAGYQKAAAIGSDCLDLSPALCDEAWGQLAAHDCALGPTFDGGYYLIALRHPEPALFRAIDWSTDAVFTQTLERARTAGLSVHELPRLHDIDTEADWRRVAEKLGVERRGFAA